MTAIYEEIVLAWDGEEITIHPNYRLVQKIEARGLSIMAVVNKLVSGEEPPMSHVAEIIAHMLVSGGAKRATPERVYEYLVARAKGDEYLRIATALITAFIPRETDPGNAEGPGDGAEPTKATPETAPTT